MKKSNYNLGEKGVVSFITVMLLSIILVMITISFVKASSSNLREALDNQLAVQAFYAAESGVNDALAVLRQVQAQTAEANLRSVFNGLGVDATDCEGFMTNGIKNYFGIGDNFNKIDSDAPISYSCVLVKSILQDVTFDPGENGKRYIIKTDGGNKIDNVNISWGKEGQMPLSATNNNVLLPPQGGWGADSDNALPMLRVTFYFPYKSGALSRTNLINNQITLYFKPINSEGSENVDIGTIIQDNKDGSVVPIKCSIGNCLLKINNIAAIDNNNDGFYARIIALYNSDTTVTITAYDSANHLLNLIDAQYSIDVTGRANDIYKRVDYRFSQLEQYVFPNNTVLSGGENTGDLCKQFVAWPGGQEDFAGCSL